jgi:hypothetical protein
MSCDRRKATEASVHLQGLRSARSRIAERCGSVSVSRRPADSLDIAILVQMYHEIAQPYALLYNLVSGT